MKIDIIKNEDVIGIYLNGKLIYSGWTQETILVSELKFQKLFKAFFDAEVTTHELDEKQHLTDEGKFKEEF